MVKKKGEWQSGSEKPYITETIYPKPGILSSAEKKG